MMQIPHVSTIVFYSNDETVLRITSVIVPRQKEKITVCNKYYSVIDISYAVLSTEIITYVKLKFLHN